MSIQSPSGFAPLSVSHRQTAPILLYKPSGLTPFGLRPTRVKALLSANLSGSLRVMRPWGKQLRKYGNNRLGGNRTHMRWTLDSTAALPLCYKPRLAGSGGNAARRTQQRLVVHWPAKSYDQSETDTNTSISTSQSVRNLQTVIRKGPAFKIKLSVGLGASGRLSNATVLLVHISLIDSPRHLPVSAALSKLTAGGSLLILKLPIFQCLVHNNVGVETLRYFNPVICLLN